MTRTGPAMLALGLALGLAQCAGPSDLGLRRQVAQLKRQLELQQEKLEQLEGQLNDGLTLALCSPELRQLLEDVQKECALATGAKATQCTTTQIRGAVINADPDHRGRFLKLMSHVPHEVLYLAKDATEALPYRIERLDRLTKPALLQSTVFLVVSSGESGSAEAVRRAQQVEQWLQARKIPPRVIRRWIYEFPANRADITRPSDLPGIFEPKELSRGVWVFRADC